MKRAELKWILVFIALFGGAICMLVIYKNDLPFFDLAYYIIIVLLALSLVVFFVKIIEDAKSKVDLVVNHFKIQATGAVAIFIISMLAAYHFKPQPKTEIQYFDLIVNVLSQDKTVEGGIIEITSGEEVPRNAVVHNGQAVFQKMPVQLKGVEILLRPQIPGFENSADSIFVPVKENYINYSLTRESTEIHGSVVDDRNRVVRNAQLDFENGLMVTYTDSMGNFRAIVPAAEGTQLSLKIYIDGTISYDNLITISSNSSKNIMLQ